MSDVQLWTYALVILSFSVYIGIALYTRVSDTKSFYIAGQGVPPLWNGMAIAADWMSAASFLSITGLIAFMGYDGAVYLMGWTGGYVLLALLLAPFLRKFGKFTVPDFVGDRYNSQSLRALAALTAVLISFVYVAGQMRGVGVVFSRFLDVPINTGVIIGVFIVFLYAGLSGMRGITWTQVAQYMVLIVAFLIPSIAISLQLSGNPLPQIGFLNVIPTLNQIQQDLGFSAYTAQTRTTLDIFCITMALMVGTAGLPHVITRFYTTPNVTGARTSAIYAILFIAALYTTVPALAVFAKTNLINQVNNRPYAEVPAWFKNWESTRLLVFSDKNGDGLIQYRPGNAFLAQRDGRPDFAQPNPDSQNELYIDNDIMVLATPEVANLSPFIIGLVAAGGLAAALSTASGLLITVSGAVAHDLYYRVFSPNASERSRLLAGRITVGLAAIAAGYFGINPPGFVAQVVALAFGLAAASFFPLLVLGIFDKRMNWQGAMAGLIVGLTFTIIYIVHFTPSLGGTGAPANLWFGISTQGIGVIGMLLNFITALIVSRLTPAPNAEIQELVESVRYPAGAGAASAAH
ncbi:sodium:solute symporter family protein [Deinococcus peraridilitoris]|uniref:Putative sodium:solute symporter, VC_2705 subfamily n=1 Tax=Deinococcus peraridilitoris (strain DSM 19664 / LMG 22246 / CIP 109416 / KR-200) TaxID=937777 RepID=L0A6H0_DEIPD|nr:sodium:solute symporter family protein [Deinococcus peraridilitoris]AFZ69044.1 putative sodium:solute symporter, VC_2705 subfamily [Deinococcus peraridilitoris DSM 19664]